MCMSVVCSMERLNEGVTVGGALVCQTRKDKRAGRREESSVNDELGVLARLNGPKGGSGRVGVRLGMTAAKSPRGGGG